MVNALIPPAPCILKLGGSLHDAPELGAWLKAVATVRGPPRILVPGGGPFADAVRAAQADMGFHDLAAHRMAILAMQQYGLALQAKEPRLVLAETEAQLRAVSAGHGAVWLPWLLGRARRAIEASWEITSDSLALWLAAGFGPHCSSSSSRSGWRRRRSLRRSWRTTGSSTPPSRACCPASRGNVRVLHRVGRRAGWRLRLAVIPARLLALGLDGAHLVSAGSNRWRGR